MTEGMNVKDYDYDLPEELIAQDPLEDRSSSRLMVLDRQTGDVEHRHFTDILEYLHPGDCLVINNTKVIPARFSDRRKKLIARTQIGHQSERKCMGSTGDLWTDQRIFPAKTVCIYPL